MGCLHFTPPYMARTGGGCSINISSIGGMMGVAGQADYCAAKSGIIGFTRAFSVEFGRSGARVSTKRRE